MKTQSRLATALALVALASLAMFGIFRWTRPVRAQDTAPPQVERISFGMVGITRGQTARISVANISDAICPCNRVILTFRDSEGQLFRNRDGQPIRKEVTLEPGQSTFLQISADALLGRDEVRINFRPVVIVIPPSIPDTQAYPPGPTIPTLEVIDNATARTTLLYPGVIRGFNPQPDPPLASPQ
ncbi:MAG TPA: hypothetical protein VJ810_24505 [Blastocatellia bacterium]|nr:hypothetical protein [Blastocatellia bacterium]